MEILNENSIFPKNVSLILGFFDGIHAGHRDVIKNTANQDKVLVTFSKSPAEYFNQRINYIYPRSFNYKLMQELGIKYIYERNFSQIAKISAKDYLDDLIHKFKPKSITTGFNHTFGANKQGNSEFIEKNYKNFEYYCTPPMVIDNEIVSSTLIKKYLELGLIPKTNKLLVNNFIIESEVIKGAQLGRKLGFPTANMEYPENIVKIPYGVYKVQALNLPAILNWGVKPTVNGSKEILEIHIPNFEKDLYGKKIPIQILAKIRDEIKFDNLDDLKIQIKKDVEECLK